MDHKRYLKAVGELAKPVAVPEQVEPEKKALIPWNRIKQLENENEVLRKNNKKLIKATGKTLFYENQNNELKKTNAKLRKTKKHLEEKFMKISNEHKENLRQIPCGEVLQKLGFEITKDGTDYIRVKNDNLNLVVNTDTNKFTENKSMEQGFGSIDLLMKVFKFEFLEAIKMLTNGFGSEALTKVALANPKTTQALVKNNIEKIVREIPKPVSKNLPKIIDYLTKVRKINKEIIDDLISKNELYADRNNNCVFINGKFAFLRGTYQEKKYASVAGEADFLQYNFGKSTDTYLFESAIDALSFRTLYPEKDGKYLAGDSRGWSLSSARNKIGGNVHSNFIQKIDYRPFDTRYIYYSTNMVDWGREKYIQHILKNDNLSLVLGRQSTDEFWSNVQISNNMIDNRYHFSYKGIP